MMTWQQLAILAPVGAGAAEVIRAGTVYSLGGTAYQTFTAPVDRLLEAMSPERLIVARGIGRTIEIEFEPNSPAVTRLELVVKRNFFQRDRATACEIITQIELEVRGPGMH